MVDIIWWSDNKKDFLCTIEFKKLSEATVRYFPWIWSYYSLACSRAFRRTSQRRLGSAPASAGFMFRLTNPKSF